MATVYLAEDLKHHRQVALKVIHPEMTAAIGHDRFLREIEIAAQLNHPHILPLHDSGVAEGQLYYVMPYITGEALRARMNREGQLPVEDALRLAREIASALGHAHHHGIVHRDIKPENVLLSGGIALVADFGIARATGVAASHGATQAATQAGMALGTPRYMSPEQASGGVVDGRSDLYALACVLYEMLAGQPPFVAPTAEGVIRQHLTVAARPITELRPLVSSGVTAAIARGLAKLPADRFATAADFAEALTHRESAFVAAATTVAAPARRPWRLVRARRALAATAAVAFAAAAFVAWEERDNLGALFGGPTTTRAMKKDWILVAAFEGPANDSSLAVAVRLLVSAALDQSAIVATVPDDQIRLALEQAGKPPGTHVDAALARELAYRRAIRAVVEGHVSRLGEGYSVVVRVLDADSVRVLATVSEAARSDDELIPTVGRVARRLRDALGERREDLRATRQFGEMMTPSFEAYRRIVKAEELFFARDARGAIALARSALELDPDFVGAWTVIGFAFGSIGEPDSALAALDEALRRPGRFPEAGRFLNQAMVAYYRGDMEAAFEAIDQALRHDPAYHYAHNSRGVFLGRMGRREEALSAIRRAAELLPFGAGQAVLRNQLVLLLELGRVAEARELARHCKGRYAQIALGDIAVAAGDWAAAESLGRAVERDPEAPADERARATSWVAVAQAASGSVSAAAQSLGRRQKRTRLLLEVVSGRLNGVPEDVASSETTAVALVTQGLWEAAAGDTARARRLLARVRTRSALEQNRLGSDPILIEAWIATRARRFGETVRILGPAARQGDDLGFVLIGTNRALKRWLVAEAYEKLGRPDSAAVYFELAMSPIGNLAATSHARIAYSYAHRRLVLLYARMGRPEEARRHWQIFSATFTRPDPEMLPLIEEARSALAVAEGMARGQQR